MKRIEEKIQDFIEDQFDEILERNGFDQARMFAKRVEASLAKRIGSWVKVAGLREKTGEAEKRNNKHVIEIIGVPPPEAPGGQPETETGTPQNFGGGSL